LYLLDQLARALVACSRVFGQELVEDWLEAQQLVRQPWHGLGKMLLQHRDRVLGVEERLAGQHLVSNDAERIKIMAVIDCLAARPLGADVARRADELALA